MGGTLLAIGISGMAMLGGLVFVDIAFAIDGASNSVHNVAVRTMRQQEAPAGTHGKVAAVYSAATSSAAILGYVTDGLFTPNGAVSAYLVGRTFGIVAGIVGWILVTVLKPQTA